MFWKPPRAITSISWDTRKTAEVIKDIRISIRRFPSLPDGTARPGNVSVPIRMLILKITSTPVIVNMATNGTTLNISV
jgi:hypothetical protein